MARGRLRSQHVLLKRGLLSAPDVELEFPLTARLAPGSGHPNPSRAAHEGKQAAPANRAGWFAKRKEIDARAIYSLRRIWIGRFVKGTEWFAKGAEKSSRWLGESPTQSGSYPHTSGLLFRLTTESVLGAVISADRRDAHARMKRSTSMMLSMTAPKVRSRPCMPEAVPM